MIFRNTLMVAGYREACLFSLFIFFFPLYSLNSNPTNQNVSNWQEKFLHCFILKYDWVFLRLVASKVQKWQNGAYSLQGKKFRSLTKISCLVSYFVCLALFWRPTGSRSCSSWWRPGKERLRRRKDISSNWREQQRERKERWKWKRPTWGWFV